VTNLSIRVDMEITAEEAAGKSEYQGQTYYFCSPGCKRSFDKDPEKYWVKLSNRINIRSLTHLMSSR